MKEEMEFFASFPRELRKYRGKHVAIIKDKVIAFGDNAIEVLKKRKNFIPKEIQYWHSFQKKRL
jgi:hypothetical protein